MSEIVVAKGGKATFACELPDSSYTGSWLQNGKPLRHDGSRILISQEGNEHILVIVKTLKGDEGKIVFKTKKGNVEIPFELNVTEPPAIDVKEFEESAQSLNNLTIGSPMVLKVPFSGASGIKATWKFNGKQIVSGGRNRIVTTMTSSTLTIDRFEKTDCGNYEVYLENSFGNLRIPVEVSLSDISQVNFETVVVAGENVTKSSTMTIEAQEVPAKPVGNIKFDNMSANHFTVSFVTTAKGGDITSYIIERSSGSGRDWQQCATFEPGEKMVKIKGLEAGKRYTFRIKSTNAFGESEPMESRPISVQKPSTSPTLDSGVVEKLKSTQNLKSGKDFKLMIPYTGFPLPISQWMKDGKKLSTKGRVTSETSDVSTTLTIAGLKGEDSGDYTLVLRNKEGNATTSFKIAIIDVPSPPIGPIVMDEVTSTDMTFSWKPSTNDGGRPLDAYLIERKDTKSPGWSKLGRVASDVTTYRATGLDKGTKYTFRIRALNSEGESKPLLSPLVLASGPPSAPGEITPAKVTAASISIKWSPPSSDGGSPVTAYTLEMREGEGDWIKVTSSRIKDTTAELVNLAEESEYEFRVLAKNTTGRSPWSATSKPITAMDTPETPVIASNIKDNFATPLTFKAGDDLLLTVPVSGIPKPTPTWSHKGKEIKPDDDRVSLKSPKGTVQLRLCDTKRGDAGAYKLVVKNCEGEADVDIIVKVTDVPGDPVGPIKPLKVTSKVIIIGWAPPSDDGGINITQYVVERKNCDSDEDEWSRVGKVFPGEELRMTSDHVEKGANYIFRINAHNALGHSNYLESTEFLADDKYKPPAIVTSPSVSDVARTSCVLSWQVPDDGGTLIIGYTVELKRVGRRNWTPLNSGRLAMDNSYKVKDLSQDCEYVFRVTAENEAGCGPHGEESEVITAKDQMRPPPTPTDIKVFDKTDKAVSLSWTSPLNLDPMFFNGYYVERCLDGSNSWIKCNDMPIRSSKYTITGLNVGDRYNFRVRPVNDGGFGEACSFAEMVEVRQLQEKPKIDFDSSLNQTLVAQASGTLRLMASILGKPSPVVRWKKDGTDLDKRGVILNNDGVTQLTIRNLTKSDSGVYTLIADNQSGTIKKTVTLLVKDSPDPPCNITLGELQDDGSLLITWEPPKNDGGNPIKHYCLQKRDAYSRSFQIVQDRITATRYHVKDLKPGCTYYFRVIAENELGRGEGNQSNLLTVIQKRGPLRIEKFKYNKLDLSKPASISLPLKPVSVKERGTAKFTCAINGKPDPEIHWSKDSLPIKANHKYSMRNHYGVCTLTVSDCRTRDVGIYCCEATNPTGKASSEANLSVNCN